MVTQKNQSVPGLVTMLIPKRRRLTTI